MATAMNTAIKNNSVKSTTRSNREFIVCQKYRLIEKFGNGSFGDIYTATDLENGEEVAAKLEKGGTKFPYLKHESRVYRSLKHGDGIPVVHYFGKEHGYNILIMDKLGENLESLFQYCGGRFSLKTVLMLAEEMINRLEFVHEKNYIHRDVKPENFVMGSGSDRNKLYLIDFGLANKYRDGPGGNHIDYREDQSLTGTARYCSLNAHSRIELSRRDDLESLAYVLLYFLRGSLPWQGVHAARPKQKYEMIFELKARTSLECLRQGHPRTFIEFLRYCRNLDFEDKPDYQLIRNEFGKLFKQRGYQRDFLYDWSLLRHQNARAMAAQQQHPELGFNPFIHL